MKKLLVVMLVLAMAGMANAAIELSIGTAVTEGESISFDVVAPEEATLGLYYVAILDTSTGSASFDLTDVSIDYIGGGTTIGLENTYATELTTLVDYIAIGLVDNVTPIDAAVGDLFTALKLNGVSAGDVYLSLVDGDLNLLGSYTVTVTPVPEPITIGLLGLGGLFLRRRK